MMSSTVGALRLLSAGHRSEAESQAMESMGLEFPRAAWLKECIWKGKC